MKPIFHILIVVMAAGILAACKSDVKSVSGQQVIITIEQQMVSSGVMNFRFSTNKEAYYHVGVVPVDQVPDLSQSNNVKSFMSLKLDEAYADYLYWRAGLLWAGTPYVAEFPTHSLQYGSVDYSFTLLQPDTDYMIFAFPVNAQTNRPDGRLFTHYTSTAKSSAYESELQFEYRVRGYWDYIYPIGQTGEVLSGAPWVGATIDSVTLRTMTDYSKPADYFKELFLTYIDYNVTDYVHFGIYVHNNDGIGDGTSSTCFEEGHTYYTATALLDGYLSDKVYAIYKFTWLNEQTQLFFKPSQSLTTDW